MNNLKVFFGWTQLVAVAYYRFFSFAKYMRKIKGVEVAYSQPQETDTGTIQWQNNLQDKGVLSQMEMLTKTADVSVLGYINNPMGVAFLQATRELYKKPILMEIDDYAFNLPAYNIASNVYKPGNTLEWILKKQLIESDGVIVSTNSLKQQYSQYNKNIYVVPNGIDFDMWDGLNSINKKSNKIRIGFSGSPNHVGDIRMIREVIPTILEKYPNVEFYFLGCVPEFYPKHERIILRDMFVKIKDFPQEIVNSNWDIGIAPLKDNSFNRGKSNLRWMELSAAQIPCVASPLPAYSESIVDGKTGFIANSNKEWIDKLSALIESKELRNKMAGKAYLEVKNNHNIKDIAKNYVEILKEVKANGQRKHTGRDKKVGTGHQYN